jgi:hypothetical protein
MKLVHCPKCHKKMPMLEADEFEKYSIVHRSVITEIQNYRSRHGVSLKEVPLSKLREPALIEYERLTGVKPSHEIFDHLWHHQVK